MSSGLAVLRLFWPSIELFYQPPSQGTQRAELSFPYGTVSFFRAQGFEGPGPYSILTALDSDFCLPCSASIYITDKRSPFQCPLFLRDCVRYSPLYSRFLRSLLSPRPTIWRNQSRLMPIPTLCQSTEHF